MTGILLIKMVVWWDHVAPFGLRMFDLGLAYWPSLWIALCDFLMCLGLVCLFDSLVCLRLCRWGCWYWFCWCFASGLYCWGESLGGGFGCFEIDLVVCFCCFGICGFLGGFASRYCCGCFCWGGWRFRCGVALFCGVVGCAGPLSLFFRLLLFCGVLLSLRFVGVYVDGCGYLSVVSVRI